MSKVLDYGCGEGREAVRLAWKGHDVIAIDKKAPKVKFMEMDCEKLEFPDNYFDMIHDRGTLPYLNKERAFSEMARVLRWDGCVKGIETLGNNPIFNLYRRIRKRNKYGKEVLIRIEDFEIAKKYFREVIIRPEPFFMGKWAYKIRFILNK